MKKKQEKDNDLHTDNDGKVHSNDYESDKM